MERMAGWTDGRVAGWTDGWTDGRTAGWTDDSDKLEGRLTLRRPSSGCLPVTHLPTLTPYITPVPSHSLPSSSLAIFHSVSPFHTSHPGVLDTCLTNASDSVSVTLPHSAAQVNSLT